MTSGDDVLQHARAAKLRALATDSTKSKAVPRILQAINCLDIHKLKQEQSQLKVEFDSQDRLLDKLDSKVNATNDSLTNLQKSFKGINERQDLDKETSEKIQVDLNAKDELLRELQDTVLAQKNDLQILQEGLQGCSEGQSFVKDNIQDLQQALTAEITTNDNLKTSLDGMIRQVDILSNTLNEKTQMTPDVAEFVMQIKDKANIVLKLLELFGSEQKMSLLSELLDRATAEEKIAMSSIERDLPNNRLTPDQSGPRDLMRATTVSPTASTTASATASQVSFARPSNSQSMSQERKLPKSIRHFEESLAQFENLVAKHPPRDHKRFIWSFIKAQNSRVAEYLQTHLLETCAGVKKRTRKSRADGKMGVVEVINLDKITSNDMVNAFHNGLNLDPLIEELGGVRRSTLHFTVKAEHKRPGIRSSSRMRLDDLPFQ